MSNHDRELNIHHKIILDYLKKSGYKEARYLRATRSICKASQKRQAIDRGDAKEITNNKNI